MGLENVFHQLPFENGEAEEGRMVKIREVLLDFLKKFSLKYTIAIQKPQKKSRGWTILLPW